MQQARGALHAKLLRSFLLAAAVVAYVKGRRWLAGDDLVRIYRKVSLVSLHTTRQDKDSQAYHTA